MPVGAGAASLLTLTVFAATAGAETAQRSQTPRALYEALLTSSVSGKLPSGFSTAKIGVSKLSDRAMKHHGVGGVEIDIDGGDAAIIYIVFPTRADAVADWKDVNLKQQAKSVITAPSRFPWPAVIANSSVTGNNVFGKKVTNGVTDLAFTSRNVIVQALTRSVDNKDSGDIPATIRLGDFALKHLNAIRR